LFLNVPKPGKRLTDTSQKGPTAIQCECILIQHEADHPSAQ